MVIAPITVSMPHDQHGSGTMSSLQKGNGIMDFFNFIFFNSPVLIPRQCKKWLLNVSLLWPHLCGQGSNHSSGLISTIHSTAQVRKGGKWFSGQKNASNDLTEVAKVTTWSVPHIILFKYKLDILFLHLGELIRRNFKELKSQY